MIGLKIFILVLGLNYRFINTSWIDLSASLLTQRNSQSINQSIFNSANFIKVASLHGHRAESHEVITEDGYILTLFRIRGNRPALPILLFHGLLDTSDTWIIRGNASLGISLANKNYDVWFGNGRGNRYSRRHKRLNPDTDAAFWDFTANEHAIDLAAYIDYILSHTGTKKLNMIGHSQGNGIIWILLSTRTEYNDKINVATALAPIAYLNNMLPPFSTLVKILVPLRQLLRKLGVTNIFGDDSLPVVLFRVISQIPILGYLIGVYGILFPLFGTDITELEPSFYPTIASHVPTWTSIKNLIYVGQLVTSGELRRFDYGEAGNLEVYNSSTPPVYELEKVKTKVVLLAARNDKLSQLADVDKLRRRLPNVVRYVINPRVNMNHIDYIWGRTAPSYLHRYIFETLEDYK